MYIIKEFQLLKNEEQKLFGWSAKWELSKINYRIHTDSIKHNLIPAEVTAKQASIIYADEVDMLNVAMFGITAKMWREQHPELKGNIRDYATINKLICLSNMENLNAVFIEQGIPQGERLIKLNQIAIHQMEVLENGGERKLLNKTMGRYENRPVVQIKGTPSTYYHNLFMDWRDRLFFSLIDTLCHDNCKNPICRRTKHEP